MPHRIFLDMNQWIYLARSYWGNPHKPSHDVVRELLAEGINRGEIQLPLQVTHLIEHLRNENPERRERLAHVLELFGRG